jgi:hypothetical protein
MIYVARAGLDVRESFRREESRSNAAESTRSEPLRDEY